MIGLPVLTGVAFKQPARGSDSIEGRIPLRNQTDGQHSAVAAKYYNPATGESWSGRGRAPKWLAAEMAKGKKKEAFLIK